MIGTLFPANSDTGNQNDWLTDICHHASTMPITTIVIYFYDEISKVCQNMILQLILQLIPPMQCKLWFDKSTTYLILELSENDERQGPSEVWVSKLLLFRRQGQVWERDPNPPPPAPQPTWFTTESDCSDTSAAITAPTLFQGQVSNFLLSRVVRGS